MRYPGLLLVCLGVMSSTGCSRPAPSLPAQLVDIPMAHKPLLPETEAACSLVGGWWERRGLPPGGPYVCDFPARDARKICTDNRQCEGRCLVAADIANGSPAIGSCSDSIRTYGCFKQIEDGVVRHVCVDGT